MPEETPQPILVYDQIDRNRRKTSFLLGLLTILLAPYFAYVSLYVAMGWLLMMGVSLLPVILGADSGNNLIALVNQYPYEATIIALLVAYLLGVLVVFRQFFKATARVLRLSGAVPVDPKQEPELRRSVENLCIGAGLPQPALYIIETPATNAFATGRDPKSAALVVTRGLLDLLERRELEGVLAHALSQIGNYETQLNSVLTAFIRMLWFPYLVVAKVVRRFFRLHWYAGAGCLIMLWLVFMPMVFSALFLFVPWSPAWKEFVEMYREAGISPAVPYILMTLPLYCLVGAPLAGLIIQRLVLRAQPFLHDANAVLLTRNPGGLARALEKMGTSDNARMDIGVALAHLCIVNPLSGWKSFFSVQPPVAARVQVLAGISRDVTPGMLAEAEQAGERHAEALSAETSEIEGKALSILKAEPKGGWSQDVTILGDGVALADMRIDAGGKTGSWSIQGTEAAVHQEEPQPWSLSLKKRETAQSWLSQTTSEPPGTLKGDLVLEVKGSVLARAERPELPFQSAAMEYQGKIYLLKSEKTSLERKYLLETEGEVVGSVEGESGFSLIRQVTARLPADLPLHVRFFIIWLVLTHWD